MKVTYLGDKKNFRAHGYDFSNKRTLDIPEGDKKAIGKFTGNRYFHVEGADQVPAPRFYVREIRRVRIGTTKSKMVKENINVYAAQTMADAEYWVQTQGELGRTHYIVSADEGIIVADDVEETGPKECGVFRKNSSGQPFARPDKTFSGDDCKEQAEQYMAEKGIDPNERILRVR